MPRLIEAILEANHRAIAADNTAGLHPGDFAESLPVVALTCIDVRLNGLLPGALGLLPEHFIWLRNAGNIITSSTSSTMRSLALACAIKGGREILILGHSDCKVGHTTMLQLTESFKKLGIERTQLPQNLTEFFGVFASERQNVLKAVEFVRQSPLIGPKVPVHGLLVDIQTGRLECLINGYDALAAATAQFAPALHPEKPSLQTAFASPESSTNEIGSAPASIGDRASAAPLSLKTAEFKHDGGASPNAPSHPHPTMDPSLKSSQQAHVDDWGHKVHVIEPSSAIASSKVRAEVARPALIPPVPPPLRRPRDRPAVKKAWWE